MKNVATGTRLYALLGDPVDHSLSPTLMNAAFGAAGLDAVYVALRITSELVPQVMRTIAASGRGGGEGGGGGGGGVGGGGNVTVPHKRAAARALDQASEAVTATGACNLFWWEEGRGLCGDNSDVEAFTQAAEALLDSSLSGRRVLVLGAGGAARAVVYACLEAEAAAIEIVNRTKEHAESLVDQLGAPAAVQVLAGPEALPAEPYDLAVNATTLGLEASDPLPLDLDVVRPDAVLDLVYGSEGTPWVRAARKMGLPAEDGRRMLLLQAAASFSSWFDKEPPLEVMARAVGLDALA